MPVRFDDRNLSKRLERNLTRLGAPGPGELRVRL